MRLQREIRVFRGDESAAFLDSIPCFSAFLREFRGLRTGTRAVLDLRGGRRLGGA